MSLKDHNALRNGMFQAVSGHITKTVRDRAKLGYY